MTALFLRRSQSSCCRWCRRRWHTPRLSPAPGTFPAYLRTYACATSMRNRWVAIGRQPASCAGLVPTCRCCLAMVSLSTCMLPFPPPGDDWPEHSLSRAALESTRTRMKASPVFAPGFLWCLSLLGTRQSFNTAEQGATLKAR